MAEWGVVQAGFRRKRYIDILADMQSRAKANFGDSIVVETNKPLGKFLDIQAWALAELWEELEEVYNSISIDTATGVALDRLVKYKAMVRRAAATASGQITITGTAGTAVPVGFIVGKEDGTTYSCTQAGTIGPEGFVKLPFTCNFVGSRGNAEIGEVNVIMTPITGITFVTNEERITNGQDEETDADLRARYLEETSGSSTVDSIKLAVKEVPGVVSALVIENPTNTVDEFGIPPKSFQVYCYGGNDEDIALAILNSKAVGIQAYGQTVVEVYDDNGYPHSIGFTRVEAIMIQVKVTIKRNQYWPYDGADQIKSNIIKYIGGTDIDGTQRFGLDVNSNVVISYLYSLVWKVAGVTDASIEIAKEGDAFGTENITIGELEIARTNPELIEVIFE